MADLFLIGGSFASIWLVLWFFAASSLVVAYPLLRRWLSHRHPSTASKLLLMMLAIPFLLSLSITVLLFLPVAEGSLVSAHCHESCQTHMPLLDSVWLGAVGLLLVFLIASAIARKLLFNVATSKKLMTHLRSLGRDTGRWFQLSDDQAMVFTLGWWRNQVFLTDGLLRQCSPRDVEIILRHELAHGRRRDNLRLLLARVFLMILPSRFSAKVYADLHLFTESACDFEAAEEYGELEVAETLLRVQKMVPVEFSYFGSELVSAFTGAEVEQRVRNLANGSAQFSNLRSEHLICIFAFALLSFVLVDPMHHGIEWLLRLH